MESLHKFLGLSTRLLFLAVTVSLVGCGSTGPSMTSTEGSDSEGTVDTSTEGGGETTSTSASKNYKSPGGTSDLSFGAGDGGAATLKSFDPGAFVRTTSASVTVDDDALSPAEFDGGEPPPPPPPDDPPPPEDDAPPPPPPDDGAPPPDDGAPPPDDGAPPPDGEFPPPPDDEFPPPPDGEFPPPPDEEFPPPPDGEFPPPPDGEFPPPPDGEFPPPPDDGFFFGPPPDGFEGALPPPPEGFGGEDGFFAPPPGFEDGGAFAVPPPPGGFEGDGGFFAPPEGFDPDGILFLPPEGFDGDAIFLPPPPEDFTGDGFFFPPSDGVEGGKGFEAPPDFFEVYNGFPPPPPDFDGEWQPPPPHEWDGSSDWEPPPPDALYADGDWYPPPPPEGWQGEWFAPPPPPEGLGEFPGDFFFSNKFDDFFGDDFFVDEGFEEGPPPFKDFPFGAFLENNSLHDIIPGVPPEFVHGAFGDFEFGEVPPPPPGFPQFPLPAEFVDGFGGFGAAFGPPPDGTGPGPLPDLPPEFFEFQERLDGLHSFLDGFEFAPPPPGPFPPGEGPFPPGEGPEGEPPTIAFVGFDEIAEFLPDDFLPPEAVAEVLDSFGENHPLIAEGGVVNPELETAMFERPPVPEGYDGFDFDGDTPQFDDMFTVYDEGGVGETMHGQVNTTFTDVTDDGIGVSVSSTTVIEAVQGEATPLVEMEPGVYQTQWVVNIRQLTNTVLQFDDPENPGATIETAQSLEALSQMTWTMVIQEVDTDGDGIPDELRVTGSNTLEMLSETVEGGPPDGFGPLPPPPPLVFPLDFQGVLDLNLPQ